MLPVKLFLNAKCDETLEFAGSSYFDIFADIFLIGNKPEFT